MYKNNYNTNSKHVDIEVSCFLDSDLARMYFDENFERVNDDLFIYIDNGNIEANVDPITVCTKTNTKNDMAKALDDLGVTYYSYLDDIKEYSFQELIDELENNAVFGDGFTDCLDENNVKYFKDYDLVTVTGYSQGDYATVIIPTKKLEQVWGASVNLDDLQKYMRNLFYDAPLYLRINISSEDYYLHDYWEYNYKYDKDEIIEAFFNHYKNVPEPEYVKEYLEENLPEYPEYL